MQTTILGLRKSNDHAMTAFSIRDLLKNEDLVIYTESDQAIRHMAELTTLSPEQYACDINSLTSFEQNLYLSIKKQYANDMQNHQCHRYDATHC